jgi:serine/arginine repetitive matrix protein 2
MTPHNLTFDPEDRTPSATPRATSPRLPLSSHQPLPLSQTLVSSLYRSDSSTSVTRSSRPVSPATNVAVSNSPLFFHRTTNGRFTPDDRTHNASGTDSFIQAEESSDSSIIGRRRPVSPLSGRVYQPMTPLSGSRPSTPSNITWNTSPTPNSIAPNGRNGSMAGTSSSEYNRSGSTASTAEPIRDSDYSRLNARSVRSTVSPESSWQDHRHASSTSLALNLDHRPPSAMSGTEIASSPVQALNRPLRSPTPTHNATYSPTSATFADQGVHVNASGNENGRSPSRRTSKQNAHSSFSFTPSQALLFGPLSNTSRSSLESAGSSYHSWDEEHKRDRLFDLFSSLDPQPEWHDFGIERSPTSTSRTTPHDDQGSENAVRRQFGLNKSDITTIQEKLVAAALTKAATPEGRHRANSVRKRRPSTSQSNYSFTGVEKVEVGV